MPFCSSVVWGDELCCYLSKGSLNLRKQAPYSQLVMRLSVRIGPRLQSQAKQFNTLPVKLLLLRRNTFSQACMSPCAKSSNKNLACNHNSRRLPQTLTHTHQHRHKGKVYTHPAITPSSLTLSYDGLCVARIMSLCPLPEQCTPSLSTLVPSSSK